ncbi:MAG: nuclear transport factor 2 family protein [Hyphomonas sp.]
MNRAEADEFAQDWLEAWNDRDLDAILAHYSDGVVFHSPRISEVLDTGAVSVTGKSKLREYWSQALEIATDLFFELDDVLVGSDAVTLLYTNHRDQQVAETFLFDEDKEIYCAIAAYR